VLKRWSRKRIFFAVVEMPFEALFYLLLLPVTQCQTSSVKIIVNSILMAF
jgi:uncharacterized protein YceK